MVAVRFVEPTSPPLRLRAQAQVRDSWDVLLPTSAPEIDLHVPIPIPLPTAMPTHFADEATPPNVQIQQLVHLHAHVPRNLGAGRPTASTTQNIVIMAPSSTSSSASSSTSEKPFFPTGSQLTPPGAGSNDGNVTKTALEWLFAVSAIVVIAALSVGRFIQLRRRNASLRSFFPRLHTLSPSSSRSHNYANSSATVRRGDSRRSFPRTTGLPSDSRVSGPVPLTLPPSLFFPSSAAAAAGGGIGRGRTGVRGAGVDAQGRRLDGGAGEDHDGIDDKDALPAYDNCHGPPKYLESEAFAVGGLVGETRTVSRVMGVAGLAGIGAGGEAYPMIDLRTTRTRSESRSGSESPSRTRMRDGRDEVPSGAVATTVQTAPRVETRDVGVGMDPEDIEDLHPIPNPNPEAQPQPSRIQNTQLNEREERPNSTLNHDPNDPNDDDNGDLPPPSPTPTSATPLRSFPSMGPSLGPAVVPESASTSTSVLFSPTYEDTDPLTRAREVEDDEDEDDEEGGRVRVRRGRSGRGSLQTSQR